jgi:hypothetical protein
MYDTELVFTSGSLGSKSVGCFQSNAADGFLVDAVESYAVPPRKPERRNVGSVSVAFNITDITVIN